MSEKKSIIERVSAMLVRNAVKKSATHSKKRTLQLGRVHTMLLHSNVVFCIVSA
jgi:hypothetical protein